MHSHIQSCKFVRVFGIRCHLPAFSTSPCAFVYFTVYYCIEHNSSVFISSPGCLEANVKAAGMQLVVANKRQEVEYQRKYKERQKEEVPEKPRRFMMQEMAGNFLYLRKHLLDFETQDPNVEWYTNVETMVQNAIQCYHLICEEKKTSYYPDIVGSFFQEGRQN